jgi:hypothetical protein
MIGKKMRAGSDIVDSLSHFPMIGAQLCPKPTIIFAIVLQKPYAKSESGTNLLIYDVY